MTKKIILGKLGIIVICSLSPLLISCKGKDDKNETLGKEVVERKVVATVNSEKIYLDELETYISQQKFFVNPDMVYNHNSSSMIIRGVLEKLIEKKLIIQEAARLNVIVTESEIEDALSRNIAKYKSGDLRTLLNNANMTLEQLRNRIAYDLLVRKISSSIIEKMVQVSERDVLSYYKKNSREFDEPLKIRALHILVDNKSKAQNILDRLKNGGDFEEIAKEESIAPEKETGGDLGFFEEGIMLEAFDNVLFSIEVGNVSTVVKTDFGYHIFKLVDKKEAKKMDKATALSRIKMNLFDRKRDEVFHLWEQELLNKAEIEIVDTFIH